MGKRKQINETVANVDKSPLVDNSTSNSQPTTPPLSEEVVATMVKDFGNFDGLKVGGKARDSMLALAQLMPSEQRESVIAFLDVAEKSGVVTGGSTRATNKSDTPPMIKFRNGFTELCKELCKEVTEEIDGVTVVYGGGVEVNKAGNNVYFFIDNNNVKRFPRVYIKAEKVEVVEVETDTTNTTEEVEKVEDNS